MFKKKKDIKNIKCGGKEQEKVESRFFSFFRMCDSLYDYQSKASRYKKQLTYLKNKAISNQMYTTD